MNSFSDNQESKKKPYICIRCGFEMNAVSACHLKCFKCGAEHDCSDKGYFW